MLPILPLSSYVIRIKPTCSRVSAYLLSVLFQVIMLSEEVEKRTIYPLVIQRGRLPQRVSIIPLSCGHEVRTRFLALVKIEESKYSAIQHQWPDQKTPQFL